MAQFDLNSWICPKCGALNPASADNCSKCDYEINEAEKPKKVKFKNILESNNKNSCFEISLKETELTTINLFPKLTKTFVCSKCLKSYPFHNESFYMCHSCKTIDYLLCKYCYDELYLNAKGNNKEDDFFKDFIMNDKNNDIKDNEKDNEEENMLYTKIHEHPLLFLFNFDAKKILI